MCSIADQLEDMAANDGEYVPAEQLVHMSVPEALL
jgi:hypothetical protein